MKNKMKRNTAESLPRYKYHGNRHAWRADGNYDQWVLYGDLDKSSAIYAKQRTIPRKSGQTLGAQVELLRWRGTWIITCLYCIINELMMELLRLPSHKLDQPRAEMEDIAGG